MVAARNDCAAIAGDMAAQRYGLRVLSANIEDDPDNKTRFLVIGRQKVGPSGRDKTSILVSTRNEPGALYRVLEPFHRHGISLTRIETRPSRTGSWTYVFFIDFDGHESAPEIDAVLNDVARCPWRSSRSARIRRTSYEQFVERGPNATSDVAAVSGRKADRGVGRANSASPTSSSLRATKTRAGPGPAVHAAIARAVDRACRVIPTAAAIG